MKATQTKLRDEFELALLDVLETDYDLDVRRADDRLNRRQKSAATLRFDYPADGQNGRQKVVVKIDGVDEATHTLWVDLQSPYDIEDSAADCEGLALAIASYLDVRRESVALDDDRLRRRWDD